MGFNFDDNDPFAEMDLTPDEPQVDPFGRLNDSSVNEEPLAPVEPEESKYVDNRGFFGDTMSTLGRGALGLTSLGANAYETITGNETGLDEWTEKTRETVDFFKPDAAEYFQEDSFLGKNWKIAMESLVPSVGAAVPGALAGAGTGAAIGSAFFGVGAVPGAAIGSIIGGLLSTGATFGAGTYGEAKKQALSQGLSEEEAHDYALKQGVIEGGLETAATGLQLATGGALSLIKQPIVQTLKGISKMGFKDVAKAYGTSVATEVTTEVIQAGLGNENAKAHGLEAGSTAEAMGNAIMPAIFMSGIFVTVSQGASLKQKAKLKKGLETKDPQAIAYVTASLEKQDPELAEGWKTYVADQEFVGEKFNVDAELTKVFFDAQAAEIEQFKMLDADPKLLLTQSTEVLNGYNNWKQTSTETRMDDVVEGRKDTKDFLEKKEYLVGQDSAATDMITKLDKATDEELLKLNDAVEPFKSYVEQGVLTQEKAEELTTLLDSKAIEATQRLQENNAYAIRKDELVAAKEQEIAALDEELKTTKPIKERRDLIDKKKQKQLEIKDAEAAMDKAKDRSATFAEDFGLDIVEQDELRKTLTQEETGQQLTPGPGLDLYNEIQGALTTDTTGIQETTTLGQKLQKATDSPLVEPKTPKKAKTPKTPKKPVETPSEKPKSTIPQIAVVSERDIIDAETTLATAQEMYTENPTSNTESAMDAATETLESLRGQRAAETSGAYVDATENNVEAIDTKEDFKIPYSNKRNLSQTEATGTSTDRVDNTDGSRREAVATSASVEEALEAGENRKIADDSLPMETPQVPKETLSKELQSLLDEDKNIKTVVKRESDNRLNKTKKQRDNKAAADKLEDSPSIIYGTDKDGNTVKLKYKDKDTGDVYVYRKHDSTGNRERGWYTPEGEKIVTSRAGIFDEQMANLKEEAEAAGWGVEFHKIATGRSDFRTEVTYRDKTKEEVFEAAVAGETLTKAKDLKKLEDFLGEEAVAKAAKELRSAHKLMRTVAEERKDLATALDGQGDATLADTLSDEVDIDGSNESYGDLALTQEKPAEGIEDGSSAWDALTTVHKNDKGKVNRPFSILAGFVRYIAGEESLKRTLIATNSKEGTRYDADANIIYLAPGASSRAIVHEALHAVTAQAIHNAAPDSRVIKQLTEVGDVLKKHLVDQGLLTEEEIVAFKMLKSNKEKQQMAKTFSGNTGRYLYALGSPAELVSMGITSKEVQSHLKKIMLPKSEQSSTLKTAWDKVVSLVGRALGIPKGQYTALNSLLEVTADLAKIDRASNKLDYNAMGLFSDLAPTEAKDFKEKYKLPNLRYNKKKKTYAKKMPGTIVWESISQLEYKTLKEVSRKKKNEVDMATHLARSKPVVAKDAVVEWVDKARATVSQTIEPVYNVVRRIAPPVAAAMNKMEWKLSDYSAKYSKATKPFMEKTKKLTAQEQQWLGQVLNNIDVTDADGTKSGRITADEVLKDFGLTEDYKKVEEVLGDIHERMSTVGLNVYKQKDFYFPRFVKDSAGLSAYLDNHPEDAGMFSDILWDANTSQAEKEAMVANVLSSGRQPHGSLRIPGSVKERTIKRINPEMQQFYHKPLDALQTHIQESNEAIETRAFIGKDDRVKVANDLYRIAKKLEEETDPKKQEELQNEYEGVAAKYDGYVEISRDSVAAYIASQDNLSEADKQALVVSIRSRLNQRGMHGYAASIRDIGLIAALGSPMNTVTQLGDFVWQVYKNGPSNVAKALIADKRITAEDFALDAPLREFQEGGLSKHVDTVLTLTKFKWLDQFAKGTSFESTLKKAEGMSSESFVKDYGELLGSDTLAKKVHQDIQSNNMTDDVRFFVFSDVSQFQPVSLSQMPAKYLMAGNGRIFYTLKSYSIKTLSNLRVASIDKMAAGDVKGGVQGLLALTALLTLANASIDELKDFLTGRDDRDFLSDHVVDNLLGLGFMSRYTLDKGFREGPIDVFLKDLLMPPGLSVLDPPLRDLYHLVSPDTDVTYKTLSTIPLVGRPLYALTPESKSKDLSREKKGIYKELRKLAKAGKGVSTEIRKKINKYNTDANVIGDTEERQKAKIKAKNIRNIQARARKDALTSTENKPKKSKGFFVSEAYAAGGDPMEQLQKQKEDFVNKMFTDVARREGKGDEVTDVVTGSYGVTQGAIESVAKSEGISSKEARSKYTDEELAKGYMMNLYDKAVEKVALQTMPEETQELVIDAMYNMGEGVLSFPKFNSAIKKNDYEAAAYELLDTANVDKQSLKGLAKRRAELYNKIAKEPVDTIVQSYSGRITYLDKDANVIMTYQPAKGKHPKSKAGTLKI